MITLENVTKVYGNKTQVKALNGISLSVKAGEIFGIIGKSGAGKSTLVRCINMLERPTSGKVIIDERDMTTLSDSRLRRERKSIGMIFQHFNLLSSRTVFDNIAFPLELTDTPKEIIRNKVEGLLELVGLSDRKSNYPSQLSGGQKQRVGIARALASDPKILLCDEATSALDPQTTTAILALLQDINKRLGITIIIITHEMAVVKDICDRVAVIEGGYITNEPKEGSDMLVRVRFKGNITTKPLMAQVIRHSNADLSVLYGNIDYIQDEPFGYLIFSIIGDMESQIRAFNYIESLPVESEVLGYVRGNN